MCAWCKRVCMCVSRASSILVRECVSVHEHGSTPVCFDVVLLRGAAAALVDGIAQCAHHQHRVCACVLCTRVSRATHARPLVVVVMATAARGA